LFKLHSFVHPEFQVENYKDIRADLLSIRKIYYQNSNDFRGFLIIIFLTINKSAILGIMPNSKDSQKIVVLFFGYPNNENEVCLFYRLKIKGT
jgi:hypothetical protein